MMIENVDWIESEGDDEWFVESGALPAGELYEVLRPALADAWRNASLDEIEALLQEVTRSLTLEQAEDFWGSLGALGKKLAPVAGQIVTVGAPILGGVIGGPVGASLGGMAGQMAGKALGSVGGHQPAPTVAAAGAASGSPATAQLMGLLQNPQLIQSVLGQLLGPAGQSTQPVGSGGAAAPFGAFMNALSVLANQAAAESDPETGSPSYMYDAITGKLLGDPASPEERAAALLHHLRAAPRYA